MSDIQIIFHIEILPKFHYLLARWMEGWKYLISKTLIFENFWGPHYIIQFSKFNNFLWVCWFLGKNRSNFVPPVWKLHNRYCHSLWSGPAKCDGSFSDFPCYLPQTLLWGQRSAWGFGWSTLINFHALPKPRPGGTISNQVGHAIPAWYINKYTIIDIPL